MQLVAAALLISGLVVVAEPVAAQESSIEGYVCPESHHGDWCEGGLGDTIITITGEAGLLTPAPEYSTISDESGRFSFSDIESGTYTISAERDNYEPFEAEYATSDGEWLLQMSGLPVSFEGALVSHEGDALDGIISAYGPEKAEFEAEGGAFSGTLTAGYYSLEAHADGHQSHYEYTLVDGQDFVFEIEKIPGRDYQLVGTILDQNGKPVEGADVYFDQCCYYYEHYDHHDEPEPADDYAESSIAYPEPYYGGNQHAVTNQNGQFEFAVAEGWYSLNANKDGYASVYENGEFTAADQELELKMEKFPDKTAVIKGTVQSTEGQDLSAVSISISNEQYGQYECSTTQAEVDQYGHDERYGCSIRVQKDGSFEGNVMPGYSIVNVYYQHWQTCNESHHGDGSYSRSCGQDYYSYVNTMVFEANSTTELDIQLTPKPGPDAEVNGYILDKEGNTISRGSINLNRLDGYGYAWAEMDQHGSYNLAVIGGYYSVSVWADGYYRWEGNVHIPSGSVTPFDIVLTEGEGRYGYCCYAYEDRGFAMAVEESHDGHAPAMVASSGDQELEVIDDVGFSEGGSEEPFASLGGLGPYDKEERSQATVESQESPALGVFLALGVLVAFVALRKR